MITPRKVGGLLVAAGFLLILSAVWILQAEQSDLQSWREVEGVVVRSQMIELPRSGPVRSSSTRYDCDWEVRYVFGGREQTVRQVRRQLAWSEATSCVAHHAPGTRVPMRSNPENEADMRSELSAWAVPTVLCVFGAVLALMGLVCWKAEAGERVAR